MSLPAPRHRYTYGDYLATEEGSPVRHEFYDGEIYAMAGGTPDHATLAVKVAAALLAQLAEQPGRVMSSDLRVRVLATGLATYPDVTVVCGPLQYDPRRAATPWSTPPWWSRS
jgi:Uma2 family endonuclease